MNIFLHHGPAIPVILFWFLCHWIEILYSLIDINICACINWHSSIEVQRCSLSGINHELEESKEYMSLRGKIGGTMYLDKPRISVTLKGVAALILSAPDPHLKQNWAYVVSLVPFLPVTQLHLQAFCILFVGTAQSCCRFFKLCPLFQPVLSSSSCCVLCWCALTSCSQRGFWRQLLGSFTSVFCRRNVGNSCHFALGAIAVLIVKQACQYKQILPCFPVLI